MQRSGLQPAPLCFPETSKGIPQEALLSGSRSQRELSTLSPGLFVERSWPRQSSASDANGYVAAELASVVFLAAQ